MGGKYLSRRDLSANQDDTQSINDIKTPREFNHEKKRQNKFARNEIDEHQSKTIPKAKSITTKR